LSRSRVSEDQIAVAAELAREVFRQDLEKQAKSRFTTTLVDQAIFTLWTLQKMSSLGRRIQEAGQPCDKDEDYRL